MFRIHISQNVMRALICKNFKNNLTLRNVSQCYTNNILNGTRPIQSVLPINIQQPKEINFPIISQKKIQDLPLQPHKIIDNPKNSLLNEIIDIIRIPNINNEILVPTNSQNIEKQAARLVVIRKRKMKKHKLKKLRKKMKFEWAKVRQRREMRKEKAFQAQLIAQIKDAEKFSAEEYVVQKLMQLNEIQLRNNVGKGKGKQLT